MRLQRTHAARRLGVRAMLALIRTMSRFLAPRFACRFGGLHVDGTLVNMQALPPISLSCFTSVLDPRADAKRRAEQKRQSLARIEEELQKVESLERRSHPASFRQCGESAIRTNFFQTESDGQLKQVISVEFESRKLTDLPLPRPLYEIFVYSPRVEGVHMRFGKVARGGIRWSDRPQDFRTEILGLVKAQQVKRGHRAGRRQGRLRAQADAERRITRCRAGGRRQPPTEFSFRRCSISPTISRTGRLIPPANVVRHEGDDPYLVVAADRGTRLSPISPIRSRSSTTTGLAMHSPRAVPPATTTKPWALRPVALGKP